MWLLLAGFYLIIRFIFTEQLDSFGPYSSYLFELACVIIALLIFDSSPLQKIKTFRMGLWGTMVSLTGGFLAFLAAGWLQISIPFDLKGVQTLLFLLVVAPVLEEFIFRYFLWQPLSRAADQLFNDVKKEISIFGYKIEIIYLIPWIITSVLFSYAHYHAIWFVSPEIHAFIYYQTSYTLLLGLACGYFVYKYNSILAAVFCHFLFNLGFYLGNILS